MIGHGSRFREKDDLPLRRGPVVKKKPPFSRARELITRKIMRTKDAQCNTVEWPYAYLLFLLDRCTISLSTICKWPLHGPRSYVDRSWERSANYSARTFLLLIFTPITISKILANSPTIFRFLIQKNKPTQSATIDLTLWIHRTQEEPKLHSSALASKKVRAP